MLIHLCNLQQIVTYGILWRFVKGDEHFHPALLVWEWTWCRHAHGQVRISWAQWFSLGVTVVQFYASCQRPAQERMIPLCRNALVRSSSSLTSSTAKRGSMSFKIGFPAVLLLRPSFNQDAHNYH